MREKNPLLKRFENDWASEAMVRQYLKNKRKRAYEQGALEVPDKYKYLKANAGMRDQAKSRKKKALQVYEAKKREKKRKGRASKENDAGEPTSSA